MLTAVEISHQNPNSGVVLTLSRVAADAVLESSRYTSAMHAVVNHLHFTAPVESDIFTAMQTHLAPHMRTFEGFTVIQVAEDHIVLIITGTGLDVLDRIATEVGSPWMKANIVPLLSRPPERLIGPIVVDMGIPASN